ncbi:MAG: AMP-dependent synthetase/ligase [Candidatus Marinamargulisbacteria bacterium]
MNSVLDIIFKQVTARSEQPALNYLDATMTYIPITYREMALSAQQFSQYLASFVQSESRVVIWSNNCWQWAISDLAIQLVGAVSVPLYPTAGEDQLDYIFNDAKPEVVIVDHLTKDRLTLLQQVSSIKKIIVIGDIEERPGNDIVIEFDDALATITPSTAFDSGAWKKDRMSDLFTILYTSGTTGVPKAVPLTHENVVSNFLGILDIIPISHTDASLSFLPLSHIFERTVGFVCVMGVGARIYYAESIDTVARDLLVAKPTFIISVPRLYEKIYQKVMGNASGAKKVILKLALAIGRNFSESNPLWKVAYKVVFSKIHEKTGGNVRFLVTGGAPISAHIETFFNAIGLPVVQGYGLTETSPIITGNLDQKVGSVGKPLDNLTVRIADDGEICVKGPNVFSGYLNVSNDDVFTDDGYFRTGDLGSLDDNGFLYVTGRKKEIIVLSNGKNVSPNLVEETLAKSAFVNQVVVVGDNHSYLVALVVPDVEQVAQTLSKSNDANALASDPDVQELILQDLKALSAPLAAFETIKKVALIPTEFSIDGKELTPTLKLRRKEINKKYEDTINALYDTNE